MGDLCYFDHDGYIYIVDRLKELIKHNGYQVAPAELEAVLLGHPQILDAAVIPVEDEEAGEIPMACVVRAADSDLSAEQIIQFVASQITINSFHMNQFFIKSHFMKGSRVAVRNSEGEIDSKGKIWAAPYRLGSMVIAYKKNKFQQHKLAPIEDWADLWRPELAGRIAMVDSPREVVGAVLKYMGASYNTDNIDLEVAGGRDAVQKNIELLQKQVRLFDSKHYLKAFGIGDVWVAVGWSSDVLPAAKRMSNVAVIIPKSGTSLWADLWAIPAATKHKTDRIGGRIRGPSPLIYQWMDFCSQAARALPFEQEVIPGALPCSLESAPKIIDVRSQKGKPKLETNLIAGVPPDEILDRCEFLEPLSDSSLSDHNWLVSSMQKNNRGANLIHIIQRSFLFLFKKV